MWQTEGLSSSFPFIRVISKGSFLHWNCEIRSMKFGKLFDVQKKKEEGGSFYRRCSATRWLNRWIPGRWRCRPWRSSTRLTSASSPERSDGTPAGTLAESEAQQTHRSEKGQWECLYFFVPCVYVTNTCKHNLNVQEEVMGFKSLVAIRPLPVRNLCCQYWQKPVFYFNLDPVTVYSKCVRVHFSSFFLRTKWTNLVLFSVFRSQIKGLNWG